MMYAGKSGHDSDGFSVVELLVTLFIAAAFLATGYMLYSTITRDSTDVRTRAQASNIAYDYMRRVAGGRSGVCTSWSPANITQDVDGLGRITIVRRATCPQPSLNSLHRVEVMVRYGQPQQEVKHAVYVST